MRKVSGRAPWDEHVKVAYRSMDQAIQNDCHEAREFRRSSEKGMIEER